MNENQQKIYNAIADATVLKTSLTGSRLSRRPPSCKTQSGSRVRGWPVQRFWCQRR